MARYATLAEKYRAHRAAFELALELGCTPKDAEKELRRREAHARMLETHAKVKAAQAVRARCGTRFSQPVDDQAQADHPIVGEQRPEFWWKQGDLA